MGQFSYVGVILLAIGLQSWIASTPKEWLGWAPLAVLAICVARRFDPGFDNPGPFPTRSSTLPWPPSSTARLGRILVLLMAAAGSALATEWSSADLHPIAAFVAWLSIPLTLSLATWRWRISPPTKPRDALDRFDAFIMLGLVLFAFALRSAWIDEIPRAYFADESRAGISIRHAWGGGMPSMFRMGWNTWSMIGLSLQGFLGPWLGLNTVSVRLASAIFGTATVATTYLLTRQLFDRKTALLAGLLLAFNRTAIDFSRLGTTHQQVMLLESLTFLALWRATRFGSATAYVWIGILAAWCLHSYNAGHAMPLILLGWLVVWILLAARRIRTHLPGTGLALLGFALIALPWLFYVTDQYDFDLNWKQFTWMSHARQIAPRILGALHDQGWQAAASILGTQVWKTWLGFTVIPAGAYQLGYRGGGILEPVSGALFVLGLPLALRLRPEGWFVVYWFAVTALTGGVLTIDPPAVVRMVGLIPALAILAAIPLRQLLDSTPSRRRVGVMATSLLLIISFAENWRTYFVEFANGTADDTSELVQLVRRLPTSSPVYLLGAEHFLHFTEDVNVEQFVFDFPERLLEDVVEPGRFLPIRNPPANVPIYLILAPTQFDLEFEARRWYPHLEATEVRHPATKRLYFRVLRLSAEDVREAADRPTSNGLRAVYSQSAKVVWERQDPQLNVYGIESFFSPTERLPIRSPYNVEWSGFLQGIGAGEYSFELVSSGPATLDFDGERVCLLESVVPENPQTCKFQRVLSAEAVALVAHWQTRTSANSSRQIFQLYWTPPGGDRRLVPADRVTPPN